MSATLTRLRRGGRRLVATAGAAAMVVSILAAPTGPAAANPELRPDSGPAVDRPDSDPLATIAQAYQVSYPDLSPEAARTAAVAQLAGEDLKEAISQRWDSFGGGWFDPHTATYHLAVTTTDTAADLTGLGQDLGVRVDTPLVERSLDELEEQAGELRAGDDPVSRAAGDQVGIDVASNQVVAAVPPGQLASLADAVPAGVRLVEDEQLEVEADVCTSRANCDDNLRAGLVLRRSGVQVCSLGFTTRASTGTRFALTAGHCHGTDGETWSNGTTIQRPIGPLFSSNAIDSGAVDVGAIQVTNTFYSSDSTGRIAMGPSSWSPVTGSTFLLNGDVVCLSASFTDPTRSGNPCGTVTDTSDSQVRGMVRIDGYDACGGDSGGGWYWLPGSGNRWAVALHSRSVQGCNAAPHVSWASPVTAFFTGLVYETG